MSRRDFRGTIDSPRPAAAWAMSAVASACLWITEQLPLWIVGVQCAAFVVSYFTRIQPPAWRRSPLTLNIFMIGITSITIRSALDGNPATISLAYFTALSQGLQLLDARPRKSEFVLVALALFQVILASNLTDSVFFPPLLVLFLVTVTWTLLVHTLAMEAAEAEEPTPHSEIFSGDLRRMTSAATLASLVLAGILFLTLPRIQTNMLRGGIGPGMSLSGFSDRVALGDVGRIRADQTVVLRVEAVQGELPEPSQAYWRGLAFDSFDGTSWSISGAENLAPRHPVNGIGRFGIDLASREEPRESAQRILREPVEAGVLFSPGRALRIEGPFQRLERDRNGGLYLPGRGDERLRYTVWSRPSSRDKQALRSDRITAPLEPAPGGPRPAERYLQLPSIDPRIRERAERLRAEHPGDFDAALAIRDELRRTGRYTDSPPPLGDTTTSPIEAFLLGEQEGHCEYFASAMVVLARSAGMPSRLVNGFAGGVPNQVGGFIEVSRADAHAWVEVHFERAGWVRFDPTPVSLRLRADGERSLLERFAEVGSAIELWWFQKVVDFDSADQIGALRGIWYGLKGRSERGNKQAPESRPFEWSNPFAGFDPVLAFGALALCAALFAAVSRARKSNDHRVPEAYQRAQRILARRGLTRSPATSARGFAETVTHALPEPGHRAFTTITERYLAERFGGEEAGDLKAELATLEHAVNRMRLRNQAHIR